MTYIYFLATLATALPITGFNGNLARAVKGEISDGLHSLSKTESVSLNSLQKELSTLNQAGKEFFSLGRHASAPKSADKVPSIVVVDGVPFGQSLTDPLPVTSHWKKLPRPFQLENTPDIDAASNQLSAKLHSTNFDNTVGTGHTLTDFHGDIASRKPLRRPFALEETPPNSIKSGLNAQENIQEEPASSLISKIDSGSPSNWAAVAKKKSMGNKNPNQKLEFLKPKSTKAFNSEKVPALKQNDRWGFTFPSDVEKNRKVNEYHAFKKKTKQRMGKGFWTGENKG